MRIDRFLKETGICKRKEVNNILKKKLVTVNKKVITDTGFKINENVDLIEYDGKKIEYSQYIYIMLNKPSGIISASEDQRETTVVDLVKEYKHRHLFPFGRLDKDSVGLLILSDDGKLAHELLSPKKHVDKKYFLRIKGRLDEGDITKFSEGIVLEDNTKCKPAKLEILNSDEISECYVTISEGKFHQLKRMFKMLGKEVIYLKRISFGLINLDESLKEGEYRLLKEKEIALLKKDNQL